MESIFGLNTIITIFQVILLLVIRPFLELLPKDYWKHTETINPRFVLGVYIAFLILIPSFSHNTFLNLEESLLASYSFGISKAWHGGHNFSSIFRWMVIVTILVQYFLLLHFRKISLFSYTNTFIVFSIICTAVSYFIGNTFPNYFSDDNYRNSIFSIYYLPYFVFTVAFYLMTTFHLVQLESKKGGKARCIALTKRGYRCKNFAQEGSKYCHLHNKP